MPSKRVETIRDEIYYQYAKIIAKSAFGLHSKKNAFAFINKTFLELKQGTKKWTEITREDTQLVQTARAYISCGSMEDLEWGHILPQSLQVNQKCPKCEKRKGIKM
jgi:hypothetical protein